MPRILGVEIPANKKVPYSLCYIYGIGLTTASSLCEEAKIDPDRRAHTLSEEELNAIAELVVSRGVRVEGDLRREISGNLKRLQAIQSYRGLRHRKGLPVRGQRTKCNARTRKGKVKTVAGKKK